MRILVAGFGRVGRAFAGQLLGGPSELELVGIAGSGDTWLPGDTTSRADLRTALDGAPLASLPGRHERWDAEAAIGQVDADVLVEATSGSLDTGEPALTNARAALARGMHVVAASKGAFVRHHAELREVAQASGLQLRVGAAAGAALPTIDLARYGLAGARIEAVDGILNGTSNYIVSRMAESRSTFADALRQAQAAGAAEADPRVDVEGIDTACKLVIIANAACGADLTLDDVRVEGITALEPADFDRAARRGHTIRLLGTLRRSGDGWQARVEPTPLSPEHALAAVAGLEKGISYATDRMDRVTLIGGKSDPSGAAAALMRDLINLSRSRAAGSD